MNYRLIVSGKGIFNSFLNLVVLLNSRAYSYGYSLGFAPNSLFIVHSEVNGTNDTKFSMLQR